MIKCMNGGQRHGHTTVQESKTCWSVPARVVHTHAVRTAVTEEGMYRLVNGQIFKVVRALYGSGQLYAKRLTDYGIFETAKGAMRLIAAQDRMTAEQAAEYGKLYGRCVRCQAPLTDEESIERGMGPVCAGKI